MDKIQPNNDINRPYYQVLVVITASFAGFSNAQAPGMAGYLIPQITSGNDIIFVSKQTGSWVGKIDSMHMFRIYLVQGCENNLELHSMVLCGLVCPKLKS